MPSAPREGESRKTDREREKDEKRRERERDVCIRAAER